MAGISNSGFNDSALRGAAPMPGQAGGGSVDFSGLKHASAERGRDDDGELHAAMLREQGAFPEEGPTPGFVTHRVRRAKKEVDRAMQGAGKGGLAGHDALSERVSQIAREVSDIVDDPQAGTAASFARLKATAETLHGELSQHAGDDPKLAALRRQLLPLAHFLDVMSKRRSYQDMPTEALRSGAAVGDRQEPPAALNVGGDDGGVSDTSDGELRAALATGDVFEIVYAIMKVMYGTAAENVRRRGLAVREKNLEQEQVRSTQQRVRELSSGFKPGAKADDKLKDATGYSDEKARAATKELKDLGWDLTPYGGAITGDTTKQQLDDLITSMDSKLTTYNNMNSIETNDLAREGQAGQAYLTGMTSILSKENQTLSGIATSLGR